DFFTVPTVLFQVLFVFIVIQHDRRRIIHFNVTSHPRAEWTAQQILEAFPFDSAPKYLLRDRDKIYGQEFRKQVEVMDIKEVLSAPRVTMAKSLCRACYRLDPPRMFGPRDCCRRGIAAMRTAFVFRLLPQSPPSLVVG